MKKVIEVDKDPRTKDKTHYSTAQKYKAVVLYKMLGNFALVARNMGIHEQTIYNWGGTDWWKEMEEDVRKQSQAKLSGNIQKIVDKAFKTVEDRLENGDWIYDQKLGQLKRKPVNAHTANQILKDGLDKTFFIEKLKRDEKKQETEETIANRLLKLSEEFQKFAKARTINAIHDERTPGLPEGEPALQVETGADQSKGSPESSEGTLLEARESTQGGQPSSGPYPSVEQGWIDSGQQLACTDSTRERIISS